MNSLCRIKRIKKIILCILILRVRIADYNFGTSRIQHLCELCKLNLLVVIKLTFCIRCKI